MILKTQTNTSKYDIMEIELTICSLYNENEKDNSMKILPVYILCYRCRILEISRREKI